MTLTLPAEEEVMTAGRSWRLSHTWPFTGEDQIYEGKFLGRPSHSTGHNLASCWS